MNTGDLQTDFVYDGLGRLRKRQEYSWSSGGGGAPPPGPPPPTGGSWSLSSETHYIYDGDRVIQERDGSNNPTVSYTRGADLSGSFEGAGGIGGLLARSSGYSSSTGNWSTHYCYHADGNGNVSYLESSSQGLGASYRYDPFGNTIASSGTFVAANVYRFSSKEIHVSSGMYYYLYRFYDPNLQRWINRDPNSEPGARLVGHWSDRDSVADFETPDSYEFTGNSPVLFVDIDGRVLWPPCQWEWPGKVKRWPIWHHITGREVKGPKRSTTYCPAYRFGPEPVPPSTNFPPSNPTWNPQLPPID